MKKRIRKLMCLALVVLLVASMAVPAMAAAASGNGTYGMFTFTWTVTCNETTGTARISVSPTATSVTAYAKNTLYNSLNDITGESVEATSTSFATTTATADNILIDEECGHMFESEITKTTGRFFVGPEEVVPGANDYPG